MSVCEFDEQDDLDAVFQPLYGKKYCLLLDFNSTITRMVDGDGTPVLDKIFIRMRSIKKSGRAKGVHRKISGKKNQISFIEGRFNKEDFYAMAKGLEDVPEGGERCFACYEMRLREAAEYAKRLGMDYFTTTLSISPLKNAAKLNEIGLKLEEEYDVHYLLSDFKKKNGYQRSVELSHEYGMYRQDYCGCVFSMRERERVCKEQTER